MMALDENLSALFAEQKKRIQAKKDQKAKIRHEKILRRDFKTKVLKEFLCWNQFIFIMLQTKLFLTEVENKLQVIKVDTLSFHSAKSWGCQNIFGFSNSLR